MTREKPKISNAVIKRLPRYRRYLIELQKKGIDKISSNEFSSLIGYTASQIRQDLNNFGGFGQQGYGYNVNALLNEISAILGLDQVYKMVIVGLGNMGSALLNYYTGYYKTGFQVIGIFDVREELIGKVIRSVPVYDFENIVDFVEDNDVDIAVICTEGEHAQEVADRLSFAGIKGIWNFAPVDIEVPEYVSIENVHLSDSLYALAYHMNRDSKKFEEQKAQALRSKSQKDRTESEAAETADSRTEE